MRRFWLLALVSGCVGTDATYQDPARGFTVRYPSAWQVEVERGAAVFSGEERAVTVMVTSAPKKESWRKEDRSLLSTTEGARLMLSELPQAQVLSKKEVVVGGLPAAIVEVGFTQEGKAYKRRQWVVEGKHRIGYVGYTAPIAKWDEGEAIAQAMVETLELGGE